MAALLPMLAMGIPAVLSGISGIMGIAGEAKKLRGGRLGHKLLVKKRAARKVHKVGQRRYVVRNRKPMKKTYYASTAVHAGKGMAYDIISQIPLLGSLAGPIVKALGGKLARMPAKRRRYFLRRLAGKGLSPMYIQRPYVGMGMLSAPGGYNKIALNNVLTKAMLKPYGKGLLAPAGGAVYRKSHLRKVHGRKQRVRVRPTIVSKHHNGRGGYMPYTWR